MYKCQNLLSLQERTLYLLSNESRRMKRSCSVTANPKKTRPYGTSLKQLLAYGTVYRSKLIISMYSSIPGDFLIAYASWLTSWICY